MSVKACLTRFVLLVPLALGPWLASTVHAGDESSGAGACPAGGCGPACSLSPPCAGGCKPCPCPGPYVHCTPEMPCMKYKCACGKPLCNVCDIQGYGYYPTCWRPWDVALNYRCPVPTPTQLVHPFDLAPGTPPGLPPGEMLPGPMPR